MDKSLYRYQLPSHLIAKEPSSRRDQSKLFVYDTKTDSITHDRFCNISSYLPKQSLLVLNNTKVLPARITLKKKTGGKVKVLFLVNEINNKIRNTNIEIINNDKSINKQYIRGMVDRKINIGDELEFSDGSKVMVVSQEEHIFTFSFSFSVSKLFGLLETYGTMPIPLYIKESPLDPRQMRERYQTIFAKKEGSAAAPTASLHFTNEVFGSLTQKGIEKTYITLHVGMGTFAPVTQKNVEEKKLHKEWYEIPSTFKRSIVQKKQEGKEVVAVGTTVVRTLESLKSDAMSLNQLKSVVGETDIFIFPPFQFKMVDHLITNFHLPESSLMMLVEAFLQYKGAKRRLIDLYHVAIKENYRFYSFGDAMIIL